MAHDGSHLYAVQPVTRLRIEQHIAVIQPEVGPTVARISLSDYAFLVNITQRQIESLPITTATHGQLMPHDGCIIITHGFLPIGIYAHLPRSDEHMSEL